MADDVLANSLAEFYTVEQIRGFWKQALDARISRSSTVIQITELAEDGQSSKGIALATIQEIDGFIQTCQAAIRIAGGETGIPPDDLGRGTDWSTKMVRA